MHSLLKRQLKKHNLTLNAIPESWGKFIQDIDEAYQQADVERSMLERTLELSSEELLQTNAEIRAVFQAFPDLFFWLDSKGKILDCKGGRAVDMYLAPTKMAGKYIVNIPFKEAAEKFQKALASSLTTNSMTSVEYSLQINNQECFYEARLVPLLKGKTIMIIRNITESKKNEEVLRKAKEKAEEAAKAKSDFLAKMSHEIRTPMNAILGFCDILADENLNPLQNEYLQTIQRAGENLLDIINDILDLSKIESGKYTVEITSCSLPEILTNIKCLLQQKAMEKEIDFKVQYSNGLPLMIQSDSLRLQQCLINLVGNAIKFTEKGHVYLKVILENVRGENWVRFDVEDTGIGIPKDKQKDIFEPFIQADNSMTRKFGGTGLGLTITSQLIAMIGGSIQLLSEPDKGSTFTILLPVSASKQSHPNNRIVAAKSKL
jgi:signal transduction histidine kinase